MDSEGRLSNETSVSVELTDHGVKAVATTNHLPKY